MFKFFKRKVWLPILGIAVALGLMSFSIVYPSIYWQKVETNLRVKGYLGMYGMPKLPRIPLSGTTGQGFTISGNSFFNAGCIFTVNPSVYELTTTPGASETDHCPILNSDTGVTVTIEAPSGTTEFLDDGIFGIQNVDHAGTTGFTVIIEGQVAAINGTGVTTTQVPDACGDILWLQWDNDPDTAGDGTTGSSVFVIGSVIQ